MKQISHVLEIFHHVPKVIHHGPSSKKPRFVKIFVLVKKEMAKLANFPWPRGKFRRFVPYERDGKLGSDSEFCNANVQNLFLKMPCDRYNWL